MNKFLGTMLMCFSLLTLVCADYKIELDNNGTVPGNINLVGVDVHTITNSTTGQVAKNASVSTAFSTTTTNSCLLYGIVLSSAYSPGVDYVVIRDTFVVNTSQAATFTILVTTVNAVAGATSGGTREYNFVQPVKFVYGILATNSASTFVTNILFRYLNR